MPRFARQKNDNAIYHIMVRGNNREKIFFCDDDKVRYLETLKRYKEKYQIKVYTYCLMDNHVHIIIDSNGQDISKIMKGISLSYTQYVNRVHGRCGHLFQDRFKSSIIDTDNYVLAASRYIHQNPIRAQITKTAIDYKWSSINIYAGKKDIYGIIDEEFILRYFSKEKMRARELFIDYIDNESEIKKSEVEENRYENVDKRVNIKGASIVSVLNKVSICFGVCVNDITTKYSKRIEKIKQVAVYLISIKSKLTHKEIGVKFGISGSCVGRKIIKAIEQVRDNNETRKYFELILQS